MSQPSSPHSPRRPGTPDQVAEPPAERRLLTPSERFGPANSDEAPVADSFVTGSFVTDSFVTDSFATDSFATEPSPTISRRDDEMARRHLPPHERRKHERHLKKRAKRQTARDTSKRAVRDRTHHEERAQVEREFAAHARQEPPTAGPKRKRMPVF